MSTDIPSPGSVVPVFLDESRAQEFVEKGPMDAEPTPYDEALAAIEAGAPLTAEQIVALGGDLS